MNLLKRALDFLKSKIDTYNGRVSNVVEISNIAALYEGDEFLNSTSPIILSVVNIEEDTIARSPQIFTPNPNDYSPNRKYNNPIQRFVASILFTAYNIVQTNNKYIFKPNLLIVEDCHRKSLVKIVNPLLNVVDFKTVFRKG